MTLQAFESESPAERNLHLVKPTATASQRSPSLLTRAHLLDRLNRELQRTKGCIVDRYVVLCVDIDRFKIVNASLGRRVADEILMSVAQLIHGLLGVRD
jgi:GGDEF domain-containing protein